MSQNKYMKDIAYDVFISYSHLDKNVTEALSHFLEGKGIRCWYAPRDILPGQEYADAIEQAMNSVKVFVLICSGRSLQSNTVHKETNLAVSDEKIIIPFKIDNCSLDGTGGMKLYLNDRHWIDAVRNLNVAFDELAQAISFNLGVNSDNEGALPASQESSPPDLTQSCTGIHNINGQAPCSDKHKQFEYNKKAYSKKQIVKIAELQPWLLGCPLASIALFFLGIVFPGENQGFMGIALVLAYVISITMGIPLTMFLKSAEDEKIIFRIFEAIVLLVPICNLFILSFEIHYSKMILNAAGLKTAFACCVSKKDIAFFEENY